MNTALQKACDAVGGQVQLARAIGVRQQTVWSWLAKTKKGVPGQYVLRIEAATGVSRFELRPDIFAPIISPPPSPPLINVRSLRERLGWSQPRLADYLRCDQATVSQIENGQIPTGPVSKLLEILAAQSTASSDTPPTILACEVAEPQVIHASDPAVGVGSGPIRKSEEFSRVDDGGVGDGERHCNAAIGAEPSSPSLSGTEG